MLLIKTRIGPSKIHGIGLFAAQFIPKGTVIWRFMPGFDLQISRNDFFKLSQAAQEQVLHYSYFNSDLKKYILSGDDARFFNHSKTPNTAEVDTEDGYGVTIATKDIDEGEEITCDYEDFDDEYDGYEGDLNHFFDSPIKDPTEYTNRNHPGTKSAIFEKDKK